MKSRWIFLFTCSLVKDLTKEWLETHGEGLATGGSPDGNGSERHRPTRSAGRAGRAVRVRDGTGGGTGAGDPLAAAAQQQPATAPAVGSAPGRVRRLRASALRAASSSSAG